MLFGSLKSGSKGNQKQQVCKEITTGVPSIGVGNQSLADVSICKSYTHQIMYRLDSAYTGYMHHRSGYYSFGCNFRFSLNSVISGGEEADINILLYEVEFNTRCLNDIPVLEANLPTSNRLSLNISRQAQTVARFNLRYLLQRCRCARGFALYRITESNHANL